MAPDATAAARRAAAPLPPPALPARSPPTLPLCNVLVDFPFARAPRGTSEERGIPTIMAGTKSDTQSAAGRRSRRGRRRAMIGRTIALLALLPLADRLPAYARFAVGLLGDPRVPASRKALLAGAVGYTVLPIDLVPNRFPIVGIFDDVIIAALAVDGFLAGVPEEVLAERLDAVGLPRAAFDEDVLRVRRLVPRPIRRVVHQIPAAIDFVGRVAREAEIGPRVRGLISKEGSPA